MVENDDSSVENDDSSVENDDSSVENDDSSVENDDSSVENDDSSVENDDSSVENDDSSVKNSRAPRYLRSWAFKQATKETSNQDPPGLFPLVAAQTPILATGCLAACLLAC